MPNTFIPCRFLLLIFILLTLSLRVSCEEETLDFDSILELIDSERAVDSEDEEFIGRHIAALKYFSENFLLWGQKEASWKKILDKALCRKVLPNGNILYKFPLYKANNDFQPIDEERGNYDFFGVFISKKTGTIYHTIFYYYHGINYRPTPGLIPYCETEDVKTLYKKLNSKNKKTVIHAAGELSCYTDLKSRAKILKRLKKNIRWNRGNKSKLYYSESKDSSTMNEWVLTETNNKALLDALSEMGAWEAVPYLESIFRYSEERIGTSYHNVAVIIYNLTKEPIPYPDGDIMMIYNHNEELKENILNNKY
jgi:hypothetical protein